MKFTIFVALATSAALVGSSPLRGLLKSRTGTTIITAACTTDTDCASGCCGFTKATCEGACVALQRDGCGHGDATSNANAAAALGVCSSLVANFQPQSAAGASSASGAANNVGSGAAAGAASSTTTSEAALGTQFITGPCSANSDCASGCCVTSKQTCGAVLAQPNKAADCIGGVAISSLDGGAATSPAPAAAASPAAAGAASSTTTSEGALGTQFITGPCSANSDCASGCCVTSKQTCGAVLAQPNKAADCIGGVAISSLDGGAATSPAPAAAASPAAPADNSGAGSAAGSSGTRGTQFITGPCAVNNDCVSGCCVTSKLTCGAVGAQPGGASDCVGGTALPNLAA